MMMNPFWTLLYLSTNIDQLHLIKQGPSVPLVLAIPPYKSGYPATLCAFPKLSNLLTHVDLFAQPSGVAKILSIQYPQSAMRQTLIMKHIE
jgi:hypothetical protein